MYTCSTVQKSNVTFPKENVLESCLSVKKAKAKKLKKREKRAQNTQKPPEERHVFACV